MFATVLLRSRNRVITRPNRDLTISARRLSQPVIVRKILLDPICRALFARLVCANSITILLGGPPDWTVFRVTSQVEPGGTGRVIQTDISRKRSRWSGEIGRYWGDVWTPDRQAPRRRGMWLVLYSQQKQTQSGQPSAITGSGRAPFCLHMPEADGAGRANNNVATENDTALNEISRERLSVSGEYQHTMETVL